MSTNKKFRIQNGADIVGELSINDVTVIDADGKIVAGAIADAVADLTASDIADLQSQVTAILGTSPETLDTLQEIVNAFQDADTNLVADVASNTSDIATINTTLTSGIATTAQGAKADTAVQPEDFFTVADGTTTTHIPNYVGSISSSTSLSTTNVSHDRFNRARTIKDMSFSENGNVIVVYGTIRNQSLFGSYMPGQTNSGGSDQLIEHWVVVWDSNGNYIHSYPMGIQNDTSTFGTSNDNRTYYSADVTDTHIFIGTHYGNIPGAETGSQYAVFEISNPTVAIAQGSAGLSSAGQTKIRVIGEKLITSSQGNQLHEGNFSVKEWMTGNTLSSPITLGQTNNWDTDKESGWLYSSPRGSSITGYNFKTNQSAPIISGIQGNYAQVSVGNKYVVVSDSVYNDSKDVRVFDVGTSNEVVSISNPASTHYWGGGVYTSHKTSTISTHGDAVVICAYNQAPRYRTHYLYDMSSATPNQHVNSFSGDNTDSSQVEQVVELTGNHKIVKTRSSSEQRYGTVMPLVDYMSIDVSEVVTPNVDASTLASKVYVDNAVANADPDLSSYSNTTEMTSAIATAKTEAQTYADGAVADAIDAAPAGLDTLNELAAALNDDANFASTVTASIATKASTSDLATKANVSETGLVGELIVPSTETSISYTGNVLGSVLTARRSTTEIYGTDIYKVDDMTTPVLTLGSWAGDADGYVWQTNPSDGQQRMFMKQRRSGESHSGGIGSYNAPSNEWVYRYNHVKVNEDSSGNISYQWVGDFSAPATISDSKYWLGIQQYGDVPNGTDSFKSTGWGWKSEGADHGIYIADSTYNTLYFYHVGVLRGGQPYPTNGTGYVKLPTASLVEGQGPWHNGNFASNFVVKGRCAIIKTQGNSVLQIFNAHSADQGTPSSIPAPSGATSSFGDTMGISPDGNVFVVADGSTDSNGTGQKLYVYDTSTIDWSSTTTTPDLSSLTPTVFASTVSIGTFDKITLSNKWIIVGGTSALRSFKIGQLDAQIHMSISGNHDIIDMHMQNDTIVHVTQQDGIHEYIIPEEVPSSGTLSINQNVTTTPIDTVIHETGSYPSYWAGSNFNNPPSVVGTVTESIIPSSSLTKAINYLENKSVDLSGYSTTEEMNTAIASADVDLSGYSTTAEMNTAIAAIPATDLTPYSTTAEMNSAITAEVANVVDAAPAALDTLNELAAALGDDANFASTVTTSLATKADTTYVDTQIAGVTVDTSGLATAAQGAKADTAVQPEDFGVGFNFEESTVLDLSSFSSTDITEDNRGDAIENIYSSGSVYGMYMRPAKYNDTHYVLWGMEADDYQNDRGIYAWVYLHNGDFVRKIVINPEEIGVNDGNQAEYPRINLTLNGDYMVVTETISGTGTGGKVKIYDLRNINDSDYGLVAPAYSADADDIQRVYGLTETSVLAFISTTGNDLVYYKVRLYDTTVPTNWSVVSEYDISTTSGSAKDMTLIGNKLSMSDGESIELFDISTWTSSWVTTWDQVNAYDNHYSGFAGSATITDDYVIFNSRGNDSIGKVTVLNASDGSFVRNMDQHTFNAPFVGELPNLDKSRPRVQVFGDMCISQSVSNGTETGLHYTSHVVRKYLHAWKISTGELIQSVQYFDIPRYTSAGTGNSDASPRVVVLPNGFVVDTGGIMYHKGTYARTGTIPTSTVNASVVATQSYVDNAVASADVDLSGYSTTSEMNTAIAAIPATDLTPYSTTAEMNSAITVEVANVVDAAPAALDTLNELAAALGDDANFASTVTASIATKADDAATTAALATKSDQTDLDTLESLIKGQDVVGTSILISAPYAEHSDGTQRAGQTYLYNTADTSSPVLTIESDDPREWMTQGSNDKPYSTTINQYGFVAIGDHGYTGGGRVSIFNPDGSLAQYLLPSSPNSSLNENFGKTVVWSESGDRLFVSAKYEDSGSIGADKVEGAIYAYTVNYGNDNQSLSFSSPTKLSPSRNFNATGGNQWFGENNSSIVSVGRKLYVGFVSYDGSTQNQGRVYIYNIDNLNASPTEIATQSNTHGNSFGSSVAANSTHWAAVAYSGASGTPEVIHIFNSSNNQLIGTIQKPNIETNDNWIQYIEMTDSHIISIGAGLSGSDNNGMYVWPLSSISSQPTYVARYGSSSDGFNVHAKSVSAKGNIILLGYHEFNDGNVNGQLHIYDVNDLSTPQKVLNQPFSTINESKFGMSASIGYTMTSPAAALETVATEITPAINELRSEISALSGTDTSLTDSISANASAIAAETAARTAAIAAIPSTDLTPYSTTAQMDSSIATAKSEAQTYADQVVAATVDAAPAALDTLNELATALGDDANFASTVTASIATKASQTDLDANTAALATKADVTALVDKASQVDLTAETTRATSAETINNQAIAILQNQVSGISTSSGSTDIKMTAEVDMDNNNIKNANDVYAARGFIDTIEADDLKVQTGTVDFEGSIVNFGSSTIIGSGFGNATDTQIDQHLNQSTANSGEFVKWNGTDYEWTDLLSGRLATDQLQVASGGSISITGPGGTFDFQDGIVMLSGSDVRVDTPTDVGQAANKGYVDGVVAATVDAAPAALDTLNELAAALGDDANFSATVTNSIATKADDAATTAALATKADDAATTAALATKADVTTVTALDVSIKGSEPAPGPELMGDVTVSDLDGGQSSSTTHSSGGIQFTRTGVEVAIFNLATEIGKEYEISYFGGMSPASGNNKLAVVPSGFVPTLSNYWANNILKDASGTNKREIKINNNAGTQSETGTFIATTTTVQIIFFNGSTDETHYIKSISVKELSFGILDTTATHVIPAINELHTELNALSSTQSGDVSGLQSQITAEAGRAASAEAVNAANILSETSARSSADAALESDIIGLQNQVGTIISGSPASLDTLVEIVSAFENADSDLSGVITANGGRLTTAENNITALDADITAEENARGAGDTALGLRLDSDKSAMNTDLANETSGRIAGDSDLSASISAEETARIAGDSSLQSAIDALTNSSNIAISSETTARTSAVSTETNDRIAGDSDLQSSIDAEVSRATGAESGLQTQISNILSNTDATALNSLAEIVAEFQNADSTLTGVVGGHGTRLTSLESGVSAIESWTTDNLGEGTNKFWTPERTKSVLTGGLCITYNSTTGTISIDETEAATALHVASSGDANALGNESPSHYRIDVYDVNGTIVN